MIATPPAPYFETVLLTDTWSKGGREFQVRFYHRPISAIVDALADAGFLIERIPEPLPDPDAFPDPPFYEDLWRRPWSSSSAHWQGGSPLDGRLKVAAPGETLGAGLRSARGATPLPRSSS